MSQNLARTRDFFLLSTYNNIHVQLKMLQNHLLIKTHITHIEELSDNRKKRYVFVFRRADPPRFPRSHLITLSFVKISMCSCQKVG